jgi:hypothetical protein
VPCDEAHPHLGERRCRVAVEVVDDIGPGRTRAGHHLRRGFRCGDVWNWQRRGKIAAGADIAAVVLDVRVTAPQLDGNCRFGALERIADDVGLGAVVTWLL